MTKDFSLARFSGPLTYNNISTSPEMKAGQRKICTVVCGAGHWLCQVEGAGQGMGPGRGRL